MSQAILLEIRVHGNSHDEIMANALAEWREYLGKPDAEMPWSTETRVYSLSANPEAAEALGVDEKAKYFAQVTVTWTPES